MRYILALLVSLFVATLPAAAQTQEPPPGCRAPLRAEFVGNADDLDYVLTDTAGLNVVFVHIFGSTTLSDLSCVPDREQGSLYIGVNYGTGSNTQADEAARRAVWDMHVGANVNRRPADFPPIEVASYQVEGMPGAEALSRDTTTAGAEVFRYALVFVFPDGARGVVTASGPAIRLEELRPRIRRIAAGLRPRRNVEQVQQDLTDAFGDMLTRLRGPILDNAFEACLAGPPTREAATARAMAAGFPEFQTETQPQSGRQWRTSAAPENDSGRVTLALMEGPSTMMAGRTSLTCAVYGPPGLAALFEQKFEARFSGDGAVRIFTISDGEISPASSGGAVRVTPGGAIGYAGLNNTESVASVTIEITPFH